MIERDIKSTKKRESEDTPLVPKPKYQKIDLSNKSQLSVVNTATETAITFPQQKNPVAEIIASPSKLSSYLSAAWPTAKTALLYIAGVVAVIPQSIYAFTFVLKTAPQSLSLALWYSTPWHLQCLAVAFALVSLGIGTYMLKNYIPRMLNRIQDIVCHYCDGMQEFLKSNFIIFMAGVAALSIMALGYYGFIWADQGIAMTVAAVNFLLTCGMRIDSLSSIIEEIRNVFNEDWQFQKALVRELKRLRPEHIERFEEQLKATVESGNPIDEAAVRKCLLKIYDKTDYIDLKEGENNAKEVIVFNPPQLIDDIKEYASKLINFGLGTAIGTSFFIFCSQSGYDGVKVLLQKVVNPEQIDSLPYAAKMALAALTGASSAALGFIAGSSLLNTAIVSYDSMLVSKLQAAKVIIIHVSSGVASTSLAGAAEMIVSKPNLYNIEAGSFSAYMLIGGNWALATGFTLNAIFAAMNQHEVSYKQTVRWLEKNKLSSESVQALKQHSHFKKQLPASHYNKLALDSAIEMKEVVVVPRLF